MVCSVFVKGRAEGREEERRKKGGLSGGAEEGYFYLGWRGGQSSKQTMLEYCTVITEEARIPLNPPMLVGGLG